MEPLTVKSSIAYCGLMCKLCFRAAECDGCKTAGNLCEKDHADEGCFQKNCCQEKGFAGCWQCSELSGCTQGIYCLGDESKVKAFAICIQQDGMDRFVACVLRNQAAGWSVEKGRDYDGRPIEEVLRMLRTGHP